jgi:hypothetical protein
LTCRPAPSPLTLRQMLKASRQNSLPDRRADYERRRYHPTAYAVPSFAERAARQRLDIMNYDSITEDRTTQGLGQINALPIADLDLTPAGLQGTPAHQEDSESLVYIGNS